MNEELIGIIDSLRQNSDSLLIHNVNNNFSNVQNLLNQETNWYADPIISLVATILFGIIGFVFFYLQSKQGDILKNTVTEIKDETTKLQKIETNIESEVNRLADINRPFYKTFPEIMRKLQEIFEIAKSNPNKSELYIMNRTSAFGKIHTYNPKFYGQYDLDYPNIRLKQKEVLTRYYQEENEILSDFTSPDDSFKYLFFEDVRKLYLLVEECSRLLKNEDFKLIVYDQDTKSDLANNFITKYLKEVHTDDDIKSDKGLEYFTYTPKSTASATSVIPARITTEKIEKDLSNKELITEKIIKEVISKHNDVIAKIKAGKIDCDDDSCWLKYSDEIPMQMYLLKSHRNGQDEYHTFIINAMSTKNRNNPDRYVDGIYSREQSIYDVFKTLFKETFKNNESFKE